MLEPKPKPDPAPLTPEGAPKEGDKPGTEKPKE